MSGRNTEQILHMLRCYHSRELHRRKDDYDFCKKCKCHTFVGQTTAVLESWHLRNEIL